MRMKEEEDNFLILKKKGGRYHIFVAIFVIVFFVVLGTISFSILEGWTISQSVYFSVATLTTVGYGDLHPTYDESRLFAAFFIFFGVGSTLASITVIATDRINVTAEIMRKRVQSRKDKKSNGND